jgi:hypothetical protein
VYIDPIKPMLKAPGTKLLKLYNGQASFKFCFQIQLAPLQRGLLRLLPDLGRAGCFVEGYVSTSSDM